MTSSAPGHLLDESNWCKRNYTKRGPGYSRIKPDDYEDDVDEAKLDKNYEIADIPNVGSLSNYLSKKYNLDFQVMSEERLNARLMRSIE